MSYGETVPLKQEVNTNSYLWVDLDKFDRTVVNTSGFIGSTLDFTLKDFLGDQFFVMKALTDASIVNLGEIKALNGDLFLLAAKISNEGTLEAPLDPKSSSRFFVNPGLF